MKRLFFLSRYTFFHLLLITPNQSDHEKLSNLRFCSPHNSSWFFRVCIINSIAKRSRKSYSISLLGVLLLYSQAENFQEFAAPIFLLLYYGCFIYAPTFLSAWSATSQTPFIMYEVSAELSTPSDLSKSGRFNSYKICMTFEHYYAILTYCCCYSL